MKLDISNDELEVHIDLSHYEKRFYEAQKWLDEQIMRDMEPFMPEDTGKLINSAKSASAGFVGTGRVYAGTTHYARKIYNGYHDNGTPIRFKKPGATSHWFRSAKDAHYQEWIDGVKRKVGGG